jgi:chromosomal replication initiation ATPase DnaA
MNIENAELARTRNQLEELRDEISALRKQVEMLRRFTGCDDERLAEIGTPGIRMADIMDAVCAFYDVPRRQMLSERRARNIARPRQVFCWLVRELTNKSAPQIGMFLARDHSTVIHAENTIARLRKVEPRLKQDTDTLRREIMQMHEDRLAA